MPENLIERVTESRKKDDEPLPNASRSNNSQEICIRSYVPPSKIEVAAKIYSPAILSHVKAMSDRDLMAATHAALRRISIDGETIDRTSNIQLTPDGSVKMIIHFLEPISGATCQLLHKDIEYHDMNREQPMLAAYIEQGALETGPYRIEMQDIPAREMSIDNAERKVKIIGKLCDMNFTATSAPEHPIHINDIQWRSNAVDQGANGTLEILFASVESANAALDHGLLWREIGILA